MAFNNKKKVLWNGPLNTKKKNLAFRVETVWGRYLNWLLAYTFTLKNYLLLLATPTLEVQIRNVQ